MTTFLLKLSGEALGGEAGVGIEPEVLKHYCDEIEAAHREGIKLAVVLGGGNLFRGAHLAEAGMDRVIGDRMGMLATVMNGLALNDFLRRRGGYVVVSSQQKKGSLKRELLLVRTSAMQRVA